jgi:hypothetical protein
MSRIPYQPRFHWDAIGILLFAVLCWIIYCLL